MASGPYFLAKRKTWFYVVDRDGKTNIVLAHTHILEERLGRRLKKGEKAVFLDGDRNNLKPENIALRKTFEHRTCLICKKKFDANVSQAKVVCGPKCRGVQHSMIRFNANRADRGEKPLTVGRFLQIKRGKQYCGICREWLSGDAFPSAESRSCRACNRKRSKDFSRDVRQDVLKKYGPNCEVCGKAKNVRLFGRGKPMTDVARDAGYATLVCFLAALRGSEQKDPNIRTLCGHCYMTEKRPVTVKKQTAPTLAS